MLGTSYRYFNFYYQAYFHENLRPCNDSYKPSFRGSLNDLLLKINSTRRDNILIPGNAQFTVSRYINVIDSDTDPNCVDAKVCPLNYFRKHRIFVYTLPIDHPDLVGLEKYRVTEILLHFAVSVITYWHGNAFPITDSFEGKYIGHQWIPLPQKESVMWSFIINLNWLLHKQLSCAN